MITEFAHLDASIKAGQREHPVRCRSCLKLRQYNHDQGTNLSGAGFCTAHRRLRYGHKERICLEYQSIET